MADEAPPREPSLFESAPGPSPEELKAMRERFEGNKYYSAVGRIATEWAIFEHSIQIEIWKQVHLDYQIGACVTTQIGNSGRLMDCLIALLTLRGASEEHLKPIRSFATKVGNFQRRRNRIVHDPLFFDFSNESDTKALRMEISAAKKPVYTPIEERIEDLYKFVVDIEDLSRELEVLILVKPLKSWPDKLPLPSSLERLDRSP